VSTIGMLLSRHHRALLLAGIATVVAAVAGLSAVFLGDNRTGGSLDAVETAAQLESEPKQDLRPSLDCAFRPFNHNSGTAYYYFDVVISEGAAPQFHERAVVFGDGSRRAFEGDQRPLWDYTIDADGNSTITSMDGETRILLYGLKLGLPGIYPVEAGIRSTVLLNLGGECRQTNLMASAH